MKKERTKKWTRKLFLLGAMILLFAMPVQAKAAASKKSLSMNKQYTKYDVTNDGKKDTILLTPVEGSYDYYSGLKIQVNGKTAYTIKNQYVYSFSAQLLTLSNNKAFLWVRGSGDNGDGTNLILQYNQKSGKFKKSADFESLFSKYGSHVYSKVKSVNGKKIVVNIYMVSFSLGTISFDVTYSYNSGSLKRSNSMSNCKVLNGGKKHNNLTANKNLTAYSKKSLSGKKYTIKKGKKVTISGFYLNGSKFLYKMKVSGNTRWMAFSKKVPSTYLFTDVFYAG